MVSNNIAATSWMIKRSNLFILFVVITGSSHVSLSLLSSNIFALDIFTMGLTNHELNELQKIKILSTIIFENVY